MATHRHDWRPRGTAVHRIQLSCRTCGKRTWRDEQLCPTCEPRAELHQRAVIERSVQLLAMTPANRAEALGVAPFVAGCDRDGCFRGLLLPAFKAGCCCYGAGEKCENCARVSADARALIHVCLRETPEEIDHALYVAMGPAAPRLRMTEERAA